MLRLPTKIAQKITQIMETVENQPWGPGTLFLLLGAVIAVRNLLEIRVGCNPIFEGLAAFVHYPLAYVAPFLTLTLLLAFWADVAPARVARLMALAWLLTLIPPLADLLLHPGTERPAIGYLQADPADLGPVWLRFFDPRMAIQGTTLGIRVEAFLAVVLAALFVILKGGRWVKALGAAVSVYVSSLFFFSLPLLLTRFFRLFNPDITLGSFLRGEGVFFRPDRETSGDSIAILWLILLLALLGLAWRRWERRFPGDALFLPKASASGSAGPVLLLAGVLIAGIATAIGLQLALPAVVSTPFDYLALAGAVAGLGFLVMAALGLAEAQPASTAYLTGLGFCITLALGRSAGLGIAAAAAPLIPLGLGIVPVRWRWAYAGCAFPLAAFGAFAAGYGLVVGPEGLARLPIGSAGPALGIALGLGLVSGLPASSPRWSPVPILAVGFALGGLATGHPGALLVFLPAGFLAGALAAWSCRLSNPQTRALISGLAAGVPVVLLTLGLINTAFVRGPWTQALCIPRLEVAKGQILANRGDWPAAGSAYRKALACDEKYVPALRALGLGIMANEKERLPRALELLSRAAELAPGSAVDLGNLGAALIQSQRGKEALPVLRQAQQLNPLSLSVAANLAQALEDNGISVEAAQAWQKYIDLAQGRPEEHDTLAIARRHLEALKSGHLPGGIGGNQTPHP